MERKLFETIEVKGMVCRNRVLMSAAADNLSDQRGYPTDAGLERFRELASGGVGLIVSGGVHVHESGRASLDKPNILCDDAICEWKRLADAVHDCGGAIALQLTHGGIGASTGLNRQGRDGVAVGEIGEESILHRISMQPIGKHHAATEEELLELIDAFGKGAARVRQAGADAVALHSAHDSLLCQFISPVTNTRTDQWGGTVENRTRFHCMVLDAIRRYAGPDFPVLIKLGMQDGFDGGLMLEDGLAVASLLSDAGYDLIEISQGLQDLSERSFGNGWIGTPMRTNINRMEDEAFFRSWGHKAKTSLSCQMALTGGIRSFEVAEDIIVSGDADMIGLCRPLIMEPDLIRAWEEGDRHRARCVSCNQCVIAMALEGKPLACSLLR